MRYRAKLHIILRDAMELETQEITSRQRALQNFYTGAINRLTLQKIFSVCQKPVTPKKTDRPDVG